MQLILHVLKAIGAVERKGSWLTRLQRRAKQHIASLVHYQFPAYRPCLILRCMLSVCAGWVKGGEGRNNQTRVHIRDCIYHRCQHWWEKKKNSQKLDFLGLLPNSSKDSWDWEISNRPYPIPNIKWKLDRNLDEWQGRLLSMECEYSEPLDELTASMMHVGKLICFSEL